MNPREQWEEIERLYHAALELPECDRASFLDRACAPGGPLRDEVDSLLEAEAALGGFLDAPPGCLAADLLDRYPGSLSTAQLIRDYEIEKLISMGGLGISRTQHSLAHAGRLEDPNQRFRETGRSDLVQMHARETVVFAITAEVALINPVIPESAEVEA